MNAPFILPGGGRKIALAGDVYQIKLTGAETGGRCAVFEFFIPPGGGPPLHVHRREEEMFYVLEGELTFTVADTKFVVPAGGFLNAVRNVPHAFKNEGNVPVRAVVVVSPAGLEEYFFDVGIPWDDAYQTPGPPPPDQLARMAAAAPKYGLEILAPPH